MAVPKGPLGASSWTHSSIRRERTPNRRPGELEAQAPAAAAPPHSRRRGRGGDGDDTPARANIAASPDPGDPAERRGFRRAGKLATGVVRSGREPRRSSRACDRSRRLRGCTPRTRGRRSLPARVRPTTTTTPAPLSTTSAQPAGSSAPTRDEAPAPDAATDVTPDPVVSLDQMATGNTAGQYPPGPVALPVRCPAGAIPVDELGAAPFPEKPTRTGSTLLA